MEPMIRKYPDEREKGFLLDDQLLLELGYS